MFCPDCGAAVAEGRKFCGKCGAALNADTAKKTAAAPSVPYVPVETVALVPAQPMSLRTKATWAMVALLVVLAGVGWWWFHRPAPPYQVQDPGIYPFQGLSADGKTMKWGFIDADGNVRILPVLDRIGEYSISDQVVAFNEGLCGIQKDGKWGFIDTSGHLIIPNQFDSVGPFVEGIARVQLGNQFGFIDKTGKYVINPQFSGAGDFHDGLAIAQSDGSWGFINKAGTFVIKPQFQAVASDGFLDGLAVACLNGKCGYIDRDGTFAIKPQFNGADGFYDGLAPVQINGKWGYIDTSGVIVINPQFDQTTTFSGGFAVVTISGHTGTINKQGKYVVNPGQYNMQPVSEGGDLMQVTSSDGVGLMTLDGKWVVNPSKALTGISAVIGKIFYGNINGQNVPISMSGKVLAGQYKGAMLDTLAQDIQNDNSALGAMISLSTAEASYSAAYPAKGFTASFDALGPAQGTPDQNHAGLIDAALATGTKDGYQFAISIPPGTSTGGTNFNYFLVAKPAAGHAGRTYCADSSGSVHSAVQGEECTVASPTAWSPQQDVGADTPQTPH
jgi:hypothetical protein